MNKKKEPLSNKRKCNYERRQITLDACHQQRVNAFKEEFEDYTTKQEELHILYEQLSNVSTDTERSTVHCKIDDLEQTLTHQCHAIKDEIDYYTNTASILYYYYDSVENEQHNAHSRKSAINRPSLAAQNKGKSILDFFSNTTTSAATEASSSTSGETSTQPEECRGPTSNDIHVSHHKTDNKSGLYDKYLHFTDNNFVKDKDECPYYICENCSSTEQILLLHEGMSICSNCHVINFVIVNNDKPSYKEPQKEISYLNYKRKNHFNEWLNQIQGKETTEIPEEVLNAILIEIKKIKVTNMAELSHQKIRELLKKLKLSKYYEHTPYIYYRITGIPNQYLSPDLEDKLRNMFEQIQVPFLKHSPPTRKNFLSYSYCIHKMLQLLGEDKYLGYFPLLKNREKLHQQEQIWKKICEELGWMFIRSL
jgi:Zn-finger protein